MCPTIIVVFRSVFLYTELCPTIIVVFPSVFLYTELCPTIIVVFLSVFLYTELCPTIIVVFPSVFLCTEVRGVFMKVFNQDIHKIKSNQVPSLPNGGYAVGNLELLKLPPKNFVSVAGSRKITSESQKWLTKAFKKIPNFIVVSGLALGTDTYAHTLALKNNNPTIAILPSGLKNIVPKTNIKIAHKIVKNGGLLISEYEPSVPPRRDTYIERNKIIANLGSFLIMPQCDKHSGTMHTVRFTKNQNKHIVLPDNNYSGNQYLIHDDSFITIIF